LGLVAERQEQAVTRAGVAQPVERDDDLRVRAVGQLALNPSFVMAGHVPVLLAAGETQQCYGFHLGPPDDAVIWHSMAACAARVLPARGGNMMLLRQRQLEADEAFELALGGAAGMWIDLGLALLAEVVHLHLGERVPLDRLLAALFDEGPEHWSLALLGRQIDAVPAFAAIARAEEIAQQISFFAVARGVARIADDADTRQDAAFVEARRQGDRKIEHLAAGIFPDLGRKIVGLGPVLELVVIAEIDLAQAAWLGPAAPEVAPVGKRQRGRTAVGAAGIVGELVRQVGCRRAEL